MRRSDSKSRFIVEGRQDLRGPLGLTEASGQNAHLGHIFA